MKKSFQTVITGITSVMGLALLLTTACKDKQPAPSNLPVNTPTKKTDKGTAPTTENVTTPAVETKTPTPSKTLVSAEPTSFEAVTSKLDAGGNLFVYVGTEQWIKGISDKVGEFRGMFTSLPDIRPNDRERISQVFDIVQRLVKGSGIEDISGAGWSGIATEKGFYRSKFILHHHPGKGTGNLWTTFGAKPHPLYGLDLLPPNTAMAFFFDLEMQDIWATIEKEALASGIPELAAGVQQLPEEFKRNLNLDFQKTLASLGGEIGVILTLDDTKPVTIPLPDRMNITIPTIGIMIAIKVVDDTIFDRIDQQLTKDQNLSQMVKRVDEADLKMRIVPVPLPLPMEVRITVARHGDYLLLATHDDMVRTAVSTKAGKTGGLKTTPDFQRLAKDLPTAGNSFSYVSPKFGETVTGLLQEVGRQVGRREPKVGEMLGKLYSMFKVPYGCSVAVNSPEGWVVTSNSNQDPSTSYLASNLAAPVAVVGLLSAIAIPNFVKARSTAQNNACINNLRQLDGAKEQWALENKKTQTSIPTWDDLIGRTKYIKVQPVCPAGGTYTLGNMTEQPTCSQPGHNLMGNR